MIWYDPFTGSYLMLFSYRLRITINHSTIHIFLDNLSKRAYTNNKKSRENRILIGGVIMANLLVDNAKVMAKGQITIPKDIRDRLNLNVGDRVSFICNDDQVIIMNSAVYAMQMLQTAMQGEAENAGISNEEDVVNLMKDIRREG